MSWSTDVATVHCWAEELGGLYDTPHGVANAVFLPYVLKFNAEEEKGIHADLARYMKFATESDSEEKLPLKNSLRGSGKLLLTCRYLN